MHIHSIPSSLLKCMHIRICQGFPKDQDQEKDQGYWWRVEFPETAVCPYGAEEEKKRKERLLYLTEYIYIMSENGRVYYVFHIPAIVGISVYACNAIHLIQAYLIFVYPILSQMYV